MSASSAPPSSSRGLPPLFKLAIDFAPLVVFFAIYNLAKAGLLGTPPARAIYLATEATMAASVVAVALSLSFTRKVSAALLLTSGMVVVFGGAAVLLDDPFFIKVKPAIVYTIYGISLITGFLTKRPLLKYIFDQGFPPMAQEGWLKFSRNFGLFFFTMAILNEVVWRGFGEKRWVDYEFYGVTVLTLGFMASQYMLISKYIEEEPRSQDHGVPITPPPPG